MNDRPSIWNVINQDKPPRALDPETHQPFPELTTKQKIVAWFWEREGRKLAVKMSAMVVPIVAIICGKLGVTPNGTEAIGIGLCALVPQCLDWVISRVGRKMGVVLKPITKIMEEQEAEQQGPWIDPTPTLTNIQPLGLQEQDKATAQAIRDACGNTQAEVVQTIRSAVSSGKPEFIVRHRNAKGRWYESQHFDKEVALARYYTLLTTKTEGEVEITGPGIP